MCTISYQKCACFVFLLAVLATSCSTHPVDSVAMKRRLHQEAAAHRLRHRRTTPRQSRRCPDADVSFKAYRADLVAVAAVDSQSANCKGECTVQFKIGERLKWPDSQPRTDPLVRLTLRNNRAQHCEADPARPKLVPHFLVNDELSKNYLLFLNSHGPHNYTAAFAPDLNKTKTYRIVKKVLGKRFTPRPAQDVHIIPKPNLNKASDLPKKLNLTCKIRGGLPIPVITWRLNGQPLSPRRSGMQKNSRRKSLLKLSHPKAGTYECVIEDVLGNRSFASYTIPRPAVKPSVKPKERHGTNSSVSVSDSRDPCPEMMVKEFCKNGGKCFYTPSMREFSCECPPGWKGEKCLERMTEVPRRYQKPQYTCILGLYTRYDNC